jgi:hypothetical protein
LRKQGAVAAVMVAKYMITELGDQLPLTGPLTDELVEKVGRAIWDSKSGRFRLSVHLGAVDKVKQLSLYYDDLAAEAGLLRQPIHRRGRGAVP